MTERRLSRIRDDDAGFTLIELMIALGVFSIFVVIIVSSLVAIMGASTRAQVISRTSSGVLVVFQNIDRQIRYADSVNFPGPGATTGSRYVEFRVPASSAANGVSTCTQWRFWPPTQSIQSRQWTEGSAPSANWATKVSNVLDPGGATYPFKLIPGVSTAPQQLQLTISAGTASAAGAWISSTFVARNSSGLSPSNSNLIVAGVSDTPICTSTGSRP